MRRLGIVLLVVSLGGCVDPDDLYALRPLTAEQLEGLYHDHSDRDRLVILVFGDAGFDNEDQREMAGLMHDVCTARGCDFAIGLGDNIYNTGVESVADDEFDDTFERPFEPFGDFDFWMVLGNHDWAGNAQAQVDYTLHSQRWLMPHSAYAVPALPPWLQMVGFDTQYVRYDQTLAAEQVGTIEDGLCDRSGWHLAFAHHPVASSGMHAGDGMVRAYVDALDDRCGVDVYFSGHEHHQEHLDLGRYHQIIQGAAAERRNVTPIEASVFAKGEMGFGIVEVTERTLEVTFYDEHEVRDEDVARVIYRSRL